MPSQLQPMKKDDSIKNLLYFEDDLERELKVIAKNRGGYSDSRNQAVYASVQSLPEKPKIDKYKRLRPAVMPRHDYQDDQRTK